MPSLLNVFIGFFLGSTVLFLYRRSRESRSHRMQLLYKASDPPADPGRFRWDPFGLIKAIEVSLHLHKQTFLAYTTTLFRKHGDTYTSHILGYRFIFTHNAENIKHMMHSGLIDFDSSPLRAYLFDPVTPHGIFTLDGQAWKESRSRLQSRLKDVRNRLDPAICEAVFQSFLRCVPPNGEVFDVQSRAFAFAEDLQSAFFLGECVDALSPFQTPAKKQFVDDLHSIKDRIVADGFRGPVRHIFPRRHFLKACERIRHFVAAQAEVQIPNEPGIQDVAEERRLFVDQVLSILLADDTIGTTISALLFSLAANQAIVAKLRASILEAVGHDPPTWQQLGSLEYVRWAIQETLRLYPPAPINPRYANKTTTLPTGGGANRTSPILMRKGDILLVSSWARHRLGTDFGEHPEEFRPERWAVLSPGMPGYIPFYKGLRTCPGQHHAMSVLTYFVARLFQTYTRVVDYNTQSWGERIGMTLENENGVHVGLL